MWYLNDVGKPYGNDTEHVKFLLELFDLIEKKSYFKSYNLVYTKGTMGFEVPSSLDIEYKQIDSTLHSISISIIDDIIIDDYYYKCLQKFNKIVIFL